MRGEHAVGQKLSELRLRPPMHNAVNDTVQIRARVDVVGDARRDERQDIARTCAAFVEPREEPVFTA